MDEKRRSNLKLAGKEEKKKVFKSAAELEREKQDARWNSGKVLSAILSSSTTSLLFSGSGGTLLDS